MLYKQCSVKDLTQNVADFNNSLSYKALRSLKSNLALNPVETTCKSMLLSTSQIASFDGLKDENHKLEISNRQLGRVSETRPLGVKFQENLKWNDHVKDIPKCFLWSLTHTAKIKTFYRLCTKLRDLQSYLYYCCSTIVTRSVHLCQGKCLQKIEFAAVSVVYGRYLHVNDIGDVKAELAPS